MISSVLFQYENAFRQGQNPDPASFLQGTGQTRSRLLVELLHSDVELRLRAGQAVKVTEYLDRFPELSRSADGLASLVETEVRLLQQLGRKPDQKQYEFDYGSLLGNRVREIFQRVTAEQSASSTSHAAAETVAYQGKVAGQLPASIGRFQILTLLGEGAFGRVYRARDPELEREVAIKVPRLQSGDAPFDVQQFLREAKAAATIRHPNVCPVYEAGVQDGQPYIVMAYIPGKSLAEVLENRPPPPGKQVALIIRKLALALQAAHDKGVVHRDLKPSNILFDQNRRDVVVTDFGLARRDDLDDAGQTRSGVIMGTPAYMSPEQARGESRNVGPAADIYALGVVLYELLAGERPFTGSAREIIDLVQDLDPLPPSARRTGVDPQLEAFCLKAMAKKPVDRFSSMRALADAMGDYLRGNHAEQNSANQSASASQESTGFADLIANALAEQKAEMSAALEAAVSKARTPLWKIMLPMGLLAVFGLVMLGLYLFTRPAVVMVRLPIDAELLKDKDLSFFLDDKPIEAEKLAGPIELTEGPHVLIVKRGETIIRRYEFNVKRGSDPLENFKDTLAPPWPMSPGVPPATVHYPLDGQGQAMLNDARRRASLGKVVGNVQSILGIISQAAGLEGKADQYLEIQDTDALHITERFTAAAWVKGKSNGGTLISRWNDKGFAFRLTATEADGIEPKGDIAPAIMPNQGMPSLNAPMPVPANGSPKTPSPATSLPPKAARSGSNSLLVSTLTMLSQSGQPPAGPASQPTSAANQKTSVIELAVNFGSKDKADQAVILRATYDPQSWTHVAATFDGHFLRLFLNGYQAAELMLADDPTFRKLMDAGKASLPTSIASSTAQLVMGQSFNGQIDDVMLFDAALTSKELMRLIHFNTIRELATPPGQWVPFAAEEADLERAKITGKLGENVSLDSSSGEARLQLEKKGEIQFPIKAKNYIVRGTLNRIDSPDGNKQAHAALLRLRRDGANSYGGYITPEGNLGLFKEVDGKIADLASNKMTLMPITCALCIKHTVEGKTVPVMVTVQANDPVPIAYVVNGDRLAWFVGNQSFLERKDEALIAGAFSLSAVNEGAVWMSNLQICVLDGTPLTPEQALYFDRNRYSIKPVFHRLVALDAVSQTATFEEIVTEYKMETYTVTETVRVKKTKTEMKTLDGKQTPIQVEYEEEIPVTKQATRSIPMHKPVCCCEQLSRMRVTDSRGNPLTLADLAKRLKPGDACLRLISDKLAPAYPYLIKAKPDTVVFLQSTHLRHGIGMPPAVSIAPPAAGGAKVPPPAMAAPIKPAEPKRTFTQLTGHANPIQTVVYSPDGSQIATADGTFWKPKDQIPDPEITHISTGKTLIRLTEKTHLVKGMYSTDGSLLACIAMGNTIKLFDTATGKEKLSNSETKSFIYDLAFSKDGKWIATGGGLFNQQPNAPASVNAPPKGEVNVWNASTGKLHISLKGHETLVTRIAFNPQGSQLATIDQAGTLRICDAGTGSIQFTIPVEQGHSASSIAYGEKYVALGLSTKGKAFIRLIHADTGKKHTDIALPAPEKETPGYAVQQLVLTADGKRLIAQDGTPMMMDGSGPNHNIWIFDVENGKQLHKIETGLKGFMAASPDGSHFGVSSRFDPKPRLKVWETATGKLLQTMEGLLDLVALKNGGEEALVGRCAEVKEDHPPLAIKLWNSTDGSLIRSLEIPGNGIASIAYSSDGKRLAAGICAIDKTKPQFFVGELHVWDTATGNELQKIKGIDGWIMQVGLDGQGNRAVATTGMATTVWEVSTGKKLHTFPGGSRMTMDPSGKTVVVAGGFGPPPEAGKPMPKSIRVFNCDDGKELPGLDLAQNVNAMTMARNGVLLTASPDGIRSWNLQNASELRKYPANVGHMLLNQADTLLVTASSRSTFTLRNSSTGASQKRLRLKSKVPENAPPEEQMFAMGFTYDARGIPMALSPDGQTLAVVALDGKSVQFKPVSELEDAGNEDIAPEEKPALHQASPVQAMPATPAPSKATTVPPKAATKVPTESAIPAGWKKLNILDMIDKGKLSVEVNDRSVNLPPISLFDNDLQTLLRSNAVNPIKLKLNFTSATELRGVRVRTSHAPKHEWTVKTTPGEASPKVISLNGQWSTYELPKAASTSEVLIEIQRIGGDNFVHINEIELYAVQDKK